MSPGYKPDAFTFWPPARDHSTERRNQTADYLIIKLTNTYNDNFLRAAL